MQWSAPYVIFRVSDTGELLEVFRADDAKMAKYWLGYIAQTGDLLCRTPAHPKHSQTTEYPEYWCHKGENGESCYAEGDWLVFAQGKMFNGRFPQEQSQTATNGERDIESGGKKCLF